MSGRSCSSRESTRHRRRGRPGPCDAGQARARGLRRLVARPHDRLRRHRPSRVGARRGGRPRLPQRGHPHRGHGPADAVVRRLPAGGLGERRRRRARRAPPRTGDGRGNDRRDGFARRSCRDAAGCDLFADEARGGGVRAQHRSADRADPDQCDLSGIADTPMLDKHDQRATFAAAGFPLLQPGEVADAMWLAATSDASGECWFVQPGRTPAPFRFPNVPGPRRQGETVGLPPIGG